MTDDNRLAVPFGQQGFNCIHYRLRCAAGISRLAGYGAARVPQEARTTSSGAISVDSTT